MAATEDPSVRAAQSRPTNVQIVFEGFEDHDGRDGSRSSASSALVLRTVLGTSSVLERGGPLARLVEDAVVVADADAVLEVHVHVQRDIEAWLAARRSTASTTSPTRWLSDRCDAERLHTLLFFAFTASAKTLDELIFDTKRLVNTWPEDRWARRDCARVLEWIEGGFDKPAARIAAALFDEGLEALNVAAAAAADDDGLVRIEQAATFVSIFDAIDQDVVGLWAAALPSGVAAMRDHVSLVRRKLRSFVEAPFGAWSIFGVACALLHATDAATTARDSELVNLVHVAAAAAGSLETMQLLHRRRVPMDAEILRRCGGNGSPDGLKVLQWIWNEAWGLAATAATAATAVATVVCDARERRVQRMFAALHEAAQRGCVENLVWLSRVLAPWHDETVHHMVGDEGCAPMDVEAEVLIVHASHLHWSWWQLLRLATTRLTRVQDPLVNHEDADYFRSVAEAVDGTLVVRKPLRAVLEAIWSLACSSDDERVPVSAAAAAAASAPTPTSLPTRVSLFMPSARLVAQCGDEAHHAEYWASVVVPEDRLTSLMRDCLAVGDLEAAQFLYACAGAPRFTVQETRKALSLARGAPAWRWFLELQRTGQVDPWLVAADPKNVRVLFEDALQTRDVDVARLIWAEHKAALAPPTGPSSSGDRDRDTDMKYWLWNVATSEIVTVEDRLLNVNGLTWDAVERATRDTLDFLWTDVFEARPCLSEHMWSMLFLRSLASHTHAHDYERDWNRPSEDDETTTSTTRSAPCMVDWFWTHYDRLVNHRSPSAPETGSESGFESAAKVVEGGLERIRQTSVDKNEWARKLWKLVPSLGTVRWMRGVGLLAEGNEEACTLAALSRFKYEATNRLPFAFSMVVPSRSVDAADPRAIGGPLVRLLERLCEFYEAHQTWFANRGTRAARLQWLVRQVDCVKGTFIATDSIETLQARVQLFVDDLFKPIRDVRAGWSARAPLQERAFDAGVASWLWARATIECKRAWIDRLTTTPCSCVTLNSPVAMDRGVLRSYVRWLRGICEGQFALGSRSDAERELRVACVFGTMAHDWMEAHLSDETMIVETHATWDFVDVVWNEVFIVADDAAEAIQRLRITVGTEKILRPVFERLLPLALETRRRFVVKESERVAEYNRDMSAWHASELVACACHNATLSGVSLLRLAQWAWHRRSQTAIARAMVPRDVLDSVLVRALRDKGTSEDADLYQWALRAMAC